MLRSIESHFLHKKETAPVKIIDITTKVCPKAPGNIVLKYFTHPGGHFVRINEWNESYNGLRRASYFRIDSDFFSSLAMVPQVVNLAKAFGTTPSELARVIFENAPPGLKEDINL